MFTSAKIITILDAKAGYWGVKLDKSSQLYLLPSERHLDDTVSDDYHLDLTTPQDIFQARMDSILEDL